LSSSSSWTPDGLKCRPRRNPRRVNKDEDEDDGEDEDEGKAG
jgi:hypothetical protein